MCGITGLFVPSLTDRMHLSSYVSAMNKALTHRGPDDEGIWQDPETPVAFGQRRLSILDLSAAGHQPMVSNSGRYVITYNGETYSMNELLPQLQDKGGFLKGHSDTELMIECFEHLGFDETLNQLIGMFAFALWDKKTKELKLVRDRLGIKPLYWMPFQGGIAFASELKALRALDYQGFEVAPSSMMAYLKYGYVPAPLTIYKNVYKLKPGHILTFKQGEEPQISCFWDFNSVANQKTYCINEKEALEELEDLLQDAVSRRLVADVPVGAFLSGGIDSS